MQAHCCAVAHHLMLAGNALPTSSRSIEIYIEKLLEHCELFTAAAMPWPFADHLAPSIAKRLPMTRTLFPYNSMA